MSFSDVRRATLLDTDAIRTLTSGTPGAPQWTDAQLLTVLQSAQNPQASRAVFVASIDSRFCGFCVVAQADISTEIESVVVALNARRRGVGRALCSAAFTWAKEKGAEQVWLEVRASNLAAQSLYELLGFVVTGRRRTYYSDPIEDAVLMSVNLSATTHL